MKNPKFARAFQVVRPLPESIRSLGDLAGNFRWTWDHGTRELFRSIDKAAWEASEHNPVLFLNSLSEEKLAQLASDANFISRLQACASELDAYLAAETWFERTYPGQFDAVRIAYFCAEFGISEGLPIYSGGLGVLAGDHLKAASDLGVPLVGVGLLYNRGYFRQRLNGDAWQIESYPQVDFYQMPLSLVRDAGEVPIRVEVEFPDRVVHCQVWRAEVGRIPLFLLDSNVMENAPTDQGITDTLYGGDQDMRIRQEMILGIGGMRALAAMGIDPTVCHMNEGHAAFLSLERIRQFMEKHQTDHRTARQVVVNGNVFTTHTPVPAGFDKFPQDLLQRYVGKAAEEAGLPFSEFVRLGRVEKNNEGEPFNMAVLAMENANHVNGVSKLHAAVTRTMFNARWPDYPESEVPVEAITNGVHTGTWISRRMQDLFDGYLGPNWFREPQNATVWEGVDAIPDEDLWTTLEDQRADLVRFVRKRLQLEWERRDGSSTDFGAINSILDPRILTVGFARRFATYKRGTLMLADRERLKRLLFHPERPIQIIVAGKSHPRDDAGKGLIQALVKFIEQEGARSRLVFVEDYDMRVARQMVQGVDIWLNNPRRPYEASGTSGMKVVPNGGLNCSILDGWWDEAYAPGMGWAIGDREDDADEGRQDWLDSQALYRLLEHEIAPLFYHRLEGGVPRGWIANVKQSIRGLAPVFCTQRMVADYTQRFYMPSAWAYRKLAGDGLQMARDALVWRDRIQQNWGQVKVLSVTDDAAVRTPLGRPFQVTARVRLGTISPSDVRVQAVVGRAGPNRDLLDTQVVDLSPTAQEGDVTVFSGTLRADRTGFQAYTVRVIPSNPAVSVPSELELVTWA